MEDFILYFVIFLAVVFLLSTFFTVRQQTAVSVERFGKFQSIRHSGLQMKIPVIDKIAARISLKIQQLDVIVETKTLDDVFVKIKVSVQFVVIKDKVYDAIYAQVKAAMNRINAAEREKVAAQYEGDAQRILIVEKAKAEAESKRLQGQGIADQRREIARGLVESVDVLQRVGVSSQEASALIVITQHYDTLQAVGQQTNSNLILLPNSPEAGSDMLKNMITSFTASAQIVEKIKDSNEQ